MTHDDPRVELPPPFADERGAIQPILEGLIQSAQFITSRKGVQRANHYHKQDSPSMYVVSGELDYFWRPAGVEVALSHLRAGPGDLIYTPARVEHVVEFPTDAAFVNFSDQHRDQEAYEADIVRLSLLVPRIPDL